MKKIIYFIVVIAILSLFFGNGDKDNEENNGLTPTPALSPNNKGTKKETDNKKKQNNTFDDGISEYEKGEYHYITLEDLEKYHANMDGVKVCVVTEINDIDKEKIQSTICKGAMMSNFNTKKNYEDTLKDDDIVAIIGTVNGYDNWGSIGKSINFDDCMVIAVGKDANEYIEECSDDSFNEYFVTTKEVIASGVVPTEDEYKEFCEKLVYKDILRNPDSYEGKMCKVSGEVDQIVEGWFSSLTIYVEDSNGDKWGCTYVYEDGETHILEGDKVTLYGECDGTSKAKNLLGKQIILPVINVKYIEIK